MKINKKDFWKAILKKKVYILVIAVIFAITGMSYTLANLEFEATKKILFETSENISTYKEFLTGSEVLKNAIEKVNTDLSVKDLERSLEINLVDNTNIIAIRVSGEKIEEIQTISDAIVEAFRDKVYEVYGEVAIYDIDNSASFHSKGNTAVVGIVAFISGFLLSSLFFTVCILLDNKIKSCKEMEEITELKSLISIPCVNHIRKKKLNIRNIRAHNTGVFKLLMTNIQFVSNSDKSKAILVTSPKSFEGKTYVATNLAIEFAKAGKKVIMIDGDMRKGRLAKIFELPNDLGLSNYLSNLNSNGNVINERINRFINDTEIRNLNVITSGNTPPNIMELLRNGKIKQLIKDLKVFYDIIIFDTTSILEAPEAIMLSSMCDLTFMMSAYGNTKVDEFKQAYEKLNKIENCMIGVGLNKIPDRKFKKQFAIFRIRIKQRMNKLLIKLKTNVKKLKYTFQYVKKLVIVFEWIGTIFLKFCATVKKLMTNCKNNIKLKSQDVKEYIKKYKAKREKIRLIESGSIIVDVVENVEKVTLENEVCKNEKEEMPETVNVASVVSNVEKQTKSKFDLIKEQQEKANIEVNNMQKTIVKEIKKEDHIAESKIGQEEIKKIHDELKEKQRVEREKREEEKRRQREKIKEFKEIDFQAEENITEEMIRRQVEMDDMIRMAEIEQEEERLNIKRQKLIRRNEKKKERIAKKELKAKEREEKKEYREKAKQLHKQELRINEELQEDNLYPKIRM